MSLIVLDTDVASTLLRQLDRGLLPGPRPTACPFNIKDFADFAEHEGLQLIRG